MNKMLKWIVGTLVFLVFVGGIVAVGLLASGGNDSSEVIIGFQTHRFREGERYFPFNPGDDIPWGGMPMHPNRWLPSGMIRSFFPFGGFFGGLLCLGFLLVLGAAVLVLVLTRSRKPVVAVASEVPSTQPAEHAEMATPTRGCLNCQRPVNNDWSHCPYCGTALTPPE